MKGEGRNPTKLSFEDLAQELLAGMSVAQISKKYDVNNRTVAHKKAQLVRRGMSPEHDLTHPIPEGYKLKGVSTLYNSTGNVQSQWVKTCEDKEAQMNLFKESIKAFIDELPKATPITIYNEHQIHEQLLTVYPLGDPHIGMLAWDKESGENWDLEIATKTFIDLFAHVVKSAPPSKECLIGNLGDFFHSDNQAGVTSRSGHSLDMDGRYAKMVQVGVMILRTMIHTALEHHETVRVINVIGNHDDTGSIFLSVLLKHVYENEPRVIIDDAPSPFHYVRWGKVLIGLHHGHTCKMEKLPGVMASDRAEDWGQTEFRYWLTGHIHHSSKKEFPGCMVESFRTLAAKDSYATYGGWRSGRDTQAIVYHKKFGEVDRKTTNIKMLDASD